MPFPPAIPGNSHASRRAFGSRGQRATKGRTLHSVSQGSRRVHRHRKAEKTCHLLQVQREGGLIAESEREDFQSCRHVQALIHDITYNEMTDFPSK